jgi:hypothetical protein
LTSNLCCFRRMMMGDSSNGALDECGSTLTPDVVVVVVVVQLRLRLRCLLPLPLPPLTLGSSSGGGGGCGSSCSSRRRPRLKLLAVDFGGEEDDNCNPTTWGGADVVVVSWIGLRASASSPTKMASAPPPPRTIWRLTCAITTPSWAKTRSGFGEPTRETHRWKCCGCSRRGG